MITFESYHSFTLVCLSIEFDTLNTYFKPFFIFDCFCALSVNKMYKILLLNLLAHIVKTALSIDSFGDPL